MYVETILRNKGRSVATISPDATIAEASAVLKDKRIGSLVASQDGRIVLGIISERDIARAVADRGAALGDMRVGDLMTREVVTCAPDDSIGEIMAIMTERRFRHLPVMQDGAMCGIISIGDVVKSRLEEVENEAAAMREYIAGN